MILCKDLVPDIYEASEDFLCVLRLLDLVANTERARNKFTDIRNPYQCPSTYLALAARYVDYEYDNFISESDNRLIMSVYPTLKRYKGSMHGIELAIKTAINLSDTLANSDNGIVTYVIKVGTDDNKYLIEITMSCQQYSSKLIDLLNYVKPIGYTYNIQRSNEYFIQGTQSGVIVGSNEPLVYNNQDMITTDRYTDTNQSKFYELSFNTNSEITDFTSVKIYFDIKYTTSDGTEYSTTIQLYNDGSETDPWTLKDYLTGKGVYIIIPKKSFKQQVFTNIQVGQNEYLQQFLVSKNYRSTWTSVEFGVGHAEYYISSSGSDTYTVTDLSTSIDVVLKDSNLSATPTVTGGAKINSSDLEHGIINIDTTECTIGDTITFAYNYNTYQYYQICKIAEADD